jgi:aminopeptidase N
LVLSQERFSYLPAEARRWVVPVQLRQLAADGGSVTSLLLDDESVQLADVDGPVVVNAGSHGFYRVQYSPELMALLSGANLAKLSPLERHQLVDDMWAAVVAGSHDIGNFCDLARSFSDESELSVWQVLASGLDWCDRLAQGATRDATQSFVRALVGPALLRHGLEAQPADSELTRQLRGLLLSTQAVLGADNSLVARARQLMARSDAEPALVSAATTIVAANGSDADWGEYVERFEKAATPQEELRYLYALAEFPTSAQMARTLALLDSAKVRSQNAPFVLNQCLSHRDHGAQAWEFVAGRWDDLMARFPKNAHTRMLEGVQRLIRPEQADAVNKFLANHPLGHSEQRLAQILERQNINVALAERGARSLERYFA